VFKKYVKQLYVEKQLYDLYDTFAYENEEENRMDAYRNNIIVIVYQAWEKIKTNDIIKSFEKTGITLKPEISENEKLYYKLRAVVEPEIKKTEEEKINESEEERDNSYIDDESDNAEEINSGRSDNSVDSADSD